MSESDEPTRHMTRVSQRTSLVLLRDIGSLVIVVAFVGAASLVTLIGEKSTAALFVPFGASD